MATSGSMVQAIAGIVFNERILIAPGAKLVAEQAMKKASEAAQQSLFAIPLSLASSPGGLSSMKEKWKFCDVGVRRNVSRLRPLWSLTIGEPGIDGVPSKRSIDRRPHVIKSS